MAKEELALTKAQKARVEREEFYLYLYVVLYWAATITFIQVAATGMPAASLITATQVFPFIAALGYSAAAGVGLSLGLGFVVAVTLDYFVGKAVRHYFPETVANKGSVGDELLHALSWGILMIPVALGILSAVASVASLTLTWPALLGLACIAAPVATLAYTGVVLLASKAVKAWLVQSDANDMKPLLQGSGKASEPKAAAASNTDPQYAAGPAHHTPTTRVWQASHAGALKQPCEKAARLPQALNDAASKGNIKQIAALRSEHTFEPYEIDCAYQTAGRNQQWGAMDALYDSSNTTYQTALLTYPVEAGDLERVKHVLASHEETHGQIKFAFRIALEYAHLPIVKELLERMGEISYASLLSEAIGNHTFVPEHRQAVPYDAARNLVLVRFLMGKCVESKVGLNQSDIDCLTPIMVAIRAGWLACVQAIIETEQVDWSAKSGNMMSRGYSIKQLAEPRLYTDGDTDQDRIAIQKLVDEHYAAWELSQVDKAAGADADDNGAAASVAAHTVIGSGDPEAREPVATATLGADAAA